MRRLTWLVIGVVLGAAGMFVSMKYHIVRAESGLHLIPKATAELSMPYVDTRQFDLAAWNEHRDLALALVRAGKGDLLENAALGGLRQAMENVLRDLRAPSGELR